MSNLRPILPALMLALLTACTSIPQDRLALGPLSSCPDSAALATRQEPFGPQDETPTLACALNALRNSKDPMIQRSPLGGRLCLLLAEREPDPGKREQLASEGVSFAETAIASGGDNDGAVHYYLAANLGLAVREHATLAMQNLKRLETEMKRALALSPDFDDGGPMRLLGGLYLKAPAWPNGIGDRDKALELLAQAVKRHPRHPINHLFYAQALWEDDEAQAKAEFALGLDKLREGPWGHNKKPWQKEFDEFQQETGLAL